MSWTDDRVEQLKTMWGEGKSASQIAKALGGEGYEVTCEEELETALAAIGTREGPMLIELKLDPHDVPRMRI